MYELLLDLQIGLCVTVTEHIKGLDVVWISGEGIADVENVPSSALTVWWISKDLSLSVTVDVFSLGSGVADVASIGLTIADSIACAVETVVVSREVTTRVVAIGRLVLESGSEVLTTAVN